MPQPAQPVWPHLRKISIISGGSVLPYPGPVIGFTPKPRSTAGLKPLSGHYLSNHLRVPLIRHGAIAENSVDVRECRIGG